MKDFTTIPVVLAMLAASAATGTIAATGTGTAAPVADLQAEPASRSSITLSWRARNDEAAIRLERRDRDGRYTTIATLPAGSGSYTDAGLVSGREVHYRLVNVENGHAAEIVQSPFAGPITITQGGTYRGNWESTDPAVYAVRIETSAPVTIEKSRIRSKNTGIWTLGYNANLTVRDTRGVALNPNVAGVKKGCFIDIGNFTAVVMENNRVEGWACGIRALNYGADADLNRHGQSVRVRYNQFRNIDGRRSDGNGGYQIVVEGSGQAIGTNTVRQANGLIEWNEVLNKPYESMVEDVISTYESGGTSGNPIVIAHNFVGGAYFADPAAQVDYSGAGINLGDCPSMHVDCAHVHAFNNVVVSFSNSGMGIAGGSDMKMFANRVVSAADTRDGVRIGSSWRSGFGFWNYYNSPNWGNNFMTDNYTFIADRSGNVAGNYTPSATADSVFNNVVEGTIGQPPNTPLNYAREKQEHREWLQTVAAAGVTLGPRP